MLSILESKNDLIHPGEDEFMTLGSKILKLHNINPTIIKTEYAVRGELAIRAEQLKNVAIKGFFFHFL